MGDASLKWEKMRSLGLHTSNLRCLLEIQMERISMQKNIEFWNSKEDKDM